MLTISHRTEITEMIRVISGISQPLTSDVAVDLSCRECEKMAALEVSDN